MVLQTWMTVVTSEEPVDLSNINKLLVMGKPDEILRFFRSIRSAFSILSTLLSRPVTYREDG